MEERIMYTQQQMDQLRNNPNVLRVTEQTITYSPAFKVSAVQANQAGMFPIEIFRQAGFPVELIGKRTPQRCLYRWRKVFVEQGENGLLEEQRGKGSPSKSVNKDISLEDKLKQAEARIKLLEAENDLLKKLEAFERQPGKELTSSERFQIVNHVIRKYELVRLTRYLCQTAEVSTSGYYRWCRAEDGRQRRMAAEREDLRLIQREFKSLNGKAGALTIKMRLEGLRGVVMNHKKIRRIMRKFKLYTTIRRANPYRQIAKATQEHRTCPNLLKRQFDQGEPEKVLLTDITYLYYGQGQRAYLSCVKDGATRQILAHHLSSSLALPIVEKTIQHLLKRIDGSVHPEAIFHSDQGMHYTHPRVRSLIARFGFRQSMSRRGNCLDNASMESFFGHLKDELDYKDSQTLEELRIRVNEYITYYNTERYQWTLKKMTPDEYRSHLIAA